MTTRRSFLASLVATAGLPALSWADAGSPDYLAAAREPDGGYALFGLTSGGVQTFRIALPGRGHAAAAHPARPEAVAFARRPGTYALVIDCARGQLIRRLEAPEGHHFSGHGAFSADGRTLFTAEIESATGAGRIGLWDRDGGYARSGQFASGGIGPHEIRLLPGQDILVVANGGIKVALDDARSKLNLDTMQPNLSYLTPGGALLEQVELPGDLHRDSIRHLAVRGDGLVACAMQWQGAQGGLPPLLALHRRGGKLQPAWAPDPEQIAMAGYAGSIAFDGAGRRVAITSPRGGRVHVFDDRGRFLAAHLRGDICGISPAAAGFATTDGTGGVGRIDARFQPVAAFDRSWDNHLVALRPGTASGA